MTRPTKDFSSLQEHNIADELGWSVVPGSGARDFHPGDIEGEDWLGECKTHVKLVDKIIFNKSVWKKLEVESMSKIRKSALFTDNGSQHNADTWVLILRKFSLIPNKNIIKDKKFNWNTNLNLDVADLNKLGVNQALAINWSTIGEVLIMNLSTFKNMIEDNL